MPNLSRKFIVFLLTSSAIYQCANIGNPEGGSRDTTPPVIDSVESTPNLQRNFNPVTAEQDIIIKFNEWVKIEDAFKQVVTSPPLTYTPKIELKGKGVVLKFDPREVLKANTTYTVNFGKAIKDITENNAVRNLRFVFSTGDIIDTAYIAGKLQDAVTGEFKEDQLIMLYESEADSLVYKQRPVYFSRSDANGNFIIENIKDTTYKIFALEDANSNYLYDQDKEKIAFLDRRVRPGEDSTSLLLRYYSSFVKPRLMGFDTETAGLVKLQTNFPHQDLVLKAANPQIKLFTMSLKDTVMVFYTPDSLRDWSLEINYLSKPADTILVSKIRRPSVDSFKLLQARSPSIEIAPGFPVELTFNHPVGQIDTSKILFIDDTTRQPATYKMDTSNTLHIVTFECRCTEQQTYSLTLLPGAILDFKGMGTDTLKLKIKGLNSLTAGTLMLEIDNLDSMNRYIITLKQDDRDIVSSTIEGIPGFQKTYNFLNPSAYTLEIVEDKNRNGRWNGGDYTTKNLPEKILLKKNISVRANWELREQITWIK
ncbi:MAG: Ig-like domain-containing protein [Saprospiraceae bacterium]|nr:Ig-like domain-containing protein [Saprospiraceae bacterium]